MMAYYIKIRLNVFLKKLCILDMGIGFQLTIYDKY
jgi:hypothetical protein